MKISQLCQKMFLFIYFKFLQRSSVTNISPTFMVRIYQLFNRLMITALEYQETDRPLYVVCVCVWRGQNTQSLLLFTFSGRSQKPPSSCMQQPRAHTHGQTCCQCPSVHEQTVTSCGSCQLSQRAALSHLWFGFDPNKPRVAHWVTWWNNWMGSSCSGLCSTLRCFYLFIFLCEVFYCILLQCSVTPIIVINSLLWAKSARNQCHIQILAPFSNNFLCFSGPGDCLLLSPWDGGLV